jgi:hypothetical protein
MFGHAEWDGPTDEFTSGYSLSLYVQNPDVVPACARPMAVSSSWVSI